MYRLLALDLDGTLLRRDQVIDDTDLAAIRELQRAGVTVTICTGRLFSGSLAAARTCGIEGAIACMEGSHIAEAGGAGAQHAHHPLEDAAAAHLRQTLRGHGLTEFVFDREGIHHHRAGAPYASYVATWSPNLRVVDDADHAWETAPLAAVAIGDAAATAAAAALLRERASDYFVVDFAVSMLPGTHAVLVRRQGPSKGTALAALCALAGCGVEDAVVIGDWVNDIPMFEVAGRSFVMGGAPDAVRAKATDLLTREHGTGGGVAEAVKRAWG